MTLTSTLRLLVIGLCLHITVFAYGSELHPITAQSSEYSLHKANCFDHLSLDLSSEESEDKSNKLHDHSQDTHSDYLFIDKADRMQHDLFVTAWLNTHLTLCLQMPCLDQPQTPPEQN